jgi:hypothetical protein
MVIVCARMVTTNISEEIVSLVIQNVQDVQLLRTPSVKRVQVITHYSQIHIIVMHSAPWDIQK